MRRFKKSISVQPRPLRHCLHCLKDQGGQGLTEYIALVLLIAVVSIAATKSLGGTIKAKIEEARGHINSDISIRDN